MKKRKKIFIALILSMCMITEPILASDSEPSITLPDSNNAYCVDYDKRLDLEVYYNGKKAINTYQVKKRNSYRYCTLLYWQIPKQEKNRQKVL